MNINNDDGDDDDNDDGGGGQGDDGDDDIHRGLTWQGRQQCLPLMRSGLRLE